MKFKTTLVLVGKNTGIDVPAEVVEALGGGRKPAVTVRIGGYSYRSTIAVMGGKNLISFSADRRAETGLEGGEEIEVELELDTAPREVVVPGDLATALAAEPAAKAFFESLSYSNKRVHVLSVEDAKTPETRARRVDKAMSLLREGRK